jgi:hypothetical protein
MSKPNSIELTVEIVTPEQALEAANTQGVRLKAASFGDGVIFTVPAEYVQHRYACMEAIREPLKNARVYPHKSDPRKFCMFHAVVSKRRDSNASLGFSLSAEVFSTNA